MITILIFTDLTLGVAVGFIAGLCWSRGSLEDFHRLVSRRLIKDQAKAWTRKEHHHGQ